MNRYLLSTLFVAAGLFIPSFNAQEENSTIEEVVVSALRQETSTSRLPITIQRLLATVLKLNKLKIWKIFSLLYQLLVSKKEPSGSGITLRGIGNFAVGNSTVPSVGYFWNGQVASISSLYEAELFDVERVEVLRGPQGTLFGGGKPQLVDLLQLYLKKT